MLRCTCWVVSSERLSLFDCSRLRAIDIETRSHFVPGVCAGPWFLNYYYWTFYILTAHRNGRTPSKLNTTTHSYIQAQQQDPLLPKIYHKIILEVLCIVPRVQKVGKRPLNLAVHPDKNIPRGSVVDLVCHKNPRECRWREGGGSPGLAHGMRQKGCQVWVVVLTRAMLCDPLSPGTVLSHLAAGFASPCLLPLSMPHALFFGGRLGGGQR